MTTSTPPKLATWLLEKCYCGSNKDSLVGDLLEEYQQGRTRAWYWNQITSAIVIAFACLLYFKSRIVFLYVACFCCEAVVCIIATSILDSPHDWLSLMGMLTLFLLLTAILLGFRIAQRIHQLRKSRSRWRIFIP